MNKKLKATSPHIIIVIITILSFYGFGIKIEPFSIDIPKITTIFILFLLSELAVHLTRRIEEASKSNIEVQKKMDAMKTEFVQTLEESKFLKVASEISNLTKLFGILSKIKNPQFTNSLFKMVTEDYTESWVNLCKNAFELRRDESDRNIHIGCWETLIRTYMIEEKKDMEIKINFDPDLINIPTFVSNESIYLDLITEIADYMVSPQILIRGRKICFFAISHLLPEFWYNWEFNKEEKYAYSGIDKYRNKIKEIVHEHKNIGSVDVRRLILIDKGYYEDQGIKSRDDMDKQHNKVFITLDPKPDKIIDEPPNRLIMEEIKKEFPELNLNLPKNQREPVYFIINREELDDIIMPKVSRKGKKNILLIGQKEIMISWKPLVKKYIDDIHLGKNSSEIGLLSQDYLKELPMAKDHDMLMVGYKDNDEIIWQMALATNLKPFHKTLLLNIIYHRDLLNQIESFWKVLKRRKKTCSLINREKLKKLV